MPLKEKKCRKFEKYNHKNLFCRLRAALCNGLQMILDGRKNAGNILESLLAGENSGGIQAITGEGLGLEDAAGSDEMDADTEGEIPDENQGEIYRVNAPPIPLLDSCGLW